MQTADLSLTLFLELVGETLVTRTRDTDRQLSLRVTEARALRTEAVGESSTGHAERSFSVLFHGPPDPVLEQGIYRLQHARIGSRDIFLVPLGPDPSGSVYEAVFNRLG